MMASKFAQHKAGPGGYKCPCCGPSPRQRKRYNRAIKRAERAQWKREAQFIMFSDEEERYDDLLGWIR